MKGAAVAAVVVVVAGAIALVLTQSGGGGVTQARAHCTAGAYECLPEVDLVDTTGTAWTGDAVAGKVVLVNFWATWCQPCIDEIPLLSHFATRYRERGLVVLGVMTDQVNDAQLAHFAERTGLRYPVVRADEGLMQVFEYPDALPTTFLYARDGSLAERHIGPLAEAWLAERIPRLLDAN